MKGRIVIAATVIAAVSLVTPKASALPPGFPDPNAFTAVDAASHIVHYPRSGAAVIIATPDGVQCSWGVPGGPDSHTDVRCSGNIPGIPVSVPDDGRAGCATLGKSGGSMGATYLYVFDRRGGSTCPPFPATLTVGQKISATNITCVVAAGNVTACIDPIVNHGFVLQPSGSWVF
ncbi:MAG TPA: hypothetical protein VKG83_20625 [Mycobacterium sp.]|nr:hypothetical protein [Mycobacterium sp.]